MKNSERIEKLEKQVQVLMNRVALLEMKANPLVPAAAPVEWAQWQPIWMLDPEVNKYAITCTGPGTGPAFAH